MKNEHIWIPDIQHSEVGFSVTHLGIAEVTGNFNDFEATLNSSKEDFSDAQIEATIDVASVNTRIEARDGHLKSPDFFDVGKHPKMSFKSKSLKRIGDGKYKMTGDLTAMNISKSVEMDLTHRGTIDSPQTQKLTAGFKLSGILKRSDFEIGPSIPTLILGDEVQININIEFQKQ